MSINGLYNMLQLILSECRSFVLLGYSVVLHDDLVYILDQNGESIVVVSYYGERIKSTYRGIIKIGMSSIFEFLWDHMELSQIERFYYAMLAMRVMTFSYALVNHRENHIYTLVTEDGKLLEFALRSDLKTMYYTYENKTLECDIHCFYRFAEIVDLLPSSFHNLSEERLIRCSRDAPRSLILNNHEKTTRTKKNAMFFDAQFEFNLSS